MKYLAKLYWKLEAYHELKHRVKLESIIQKYHQGIQVPITHGEKHVKIKPSALYLFFHKYYSDIADKEYSKLGLIR